MQRVRASVEGKVSRCLFLWRIDYLVEKQMELTGNKIYGGNWEFHIQELQVLTEAIEYRATVCRGKEQHRCAVRVSKLALKNWAISLPQDSSQ